MAAPLLLFRQHRRAVSRQPLGSEHLRVCIVSAKDSQRQKEVFIGKKIGDRHMGLAFAEARAWN